MLLAPTIHLMRTPLGGRGFECFSEDPVLTARIAVAYVRGVQDAGVACAVKHFICNDSETQRWTSDIRVAEHVLRELYLVPFEELRPGGGRAGRHGRLQLRQRDHDDRERPAAAGRPQGRVGVRPAWCVSDWHAARSTEETAAAGLDLAMPGPSGPWGERLSAAVRAGRIAEADVDDKVRRVLHLASRVGALDGSPGTALSMARPAGRRRLRDGHRSPGSSCDPALLRRAAAAAFTLLGNEDGALPLDPAPLGSAGRHRPECLASRDPGRRQRGRQPGQRVPPGRRAARRIGRARAR